MTSLEKFAKTDHIHSLHQLLAEESDPQRRINHLTELSWYLVERERLIAEVLATEAKQACVAPPFDDQAYEIGIAHANLTLARLAFRQANYEHAIRLAHEAQAYLEASQETVRLADVYLCISLCHSELGNSAEASRYVIESIELAKATGDKTAYARGLHHLALDNDSPNELKHALAAAVEACDEEMVALASANLAKFTLNKSELDEQSHTFIANLLDEALSIATKIEWKPLQGFALSVRAAFYRQLGDLESAEKDCYQSLEIGRSADDPRLLSLILLSCAAFERARGATNLATDLLNEGLQLNIATKQRPGLLQVYNALSDLHEAEGDLAAALQFHKRASELSSVLNDEMRAQQQLLSQISHEADSARRAAEYEREKNIELEKRVAVRTAELEASLAREHILKREVETSLAFESEMSELKSRIITTVSHEFRTPMTVISSSAELLEKYRQQLSQEQSDRHLSRIRESVFRLRDLLTDVALVNDEGPRAIEPRCTRIEFAQLAEQLMQLPNGALLAQPNVRFTYEASNSRSLLLDVDLFARLVSNLLSNSIKFSAEITPINVNMTIVDNCLKFTVQDNGIGILPEEREKVFGLFYRGSNIGDQSGVGLGLNVVARITNALGGQLSLESDGHNCGTLVTVKLPCGLGNSAENIASYEKVLALNGA